MIYCDEILRLKIFEEETLWRLDYIGSYVRFPYNWDKVWAGESFGSLFYCDWKGRRFNDPHEICLEIPDALTKRIFENQYWDTSVHNVEVSCEQDGDDPDKCQEGEPTI